MGEGMGQEAVGEQGTVNRNIFQTPLARWPGGHFFIIPWMVDSVSQSLSRLQAQERHRLVLLALSWVADGVKDTLKTTSLALESCGNLPGDILSIQHQGRKSWRKQLEMQFTGANQVERLAGVSTNEKYFQAIKQI